MHATATDAALPMTEGFRDMPTRGSDMPTPRCRARTVGICGTRMSTRWGFAYPMPMSTGERRYCVPHDIDLRSCPERRRRWNEPRHDGGENELRRRDKPR